MQPVLTIAEMRAADAAAQDGVGLDQLVARAGAAVAAAALDLLDGAYGRRVVAVCGPGNNGADGRVALHLLHRRGAATSVVEAGSTDEVGSCDLVIDAAYGTGFRGDYAAPSVPETTPVLAVDIPSGVHGDTGEASGAPMAAAVTVTFAAWKPGLLQGQGKRLAGRVDVADIGLPTGDPRVWVMEDADVTSLYRPRPPGSNKWSAAVLVVAGSPGMTGAAALCSHAAYRAGAGMVRLGVPGAGLDATAPSEAVAVELGADGWAAPALEAASRCSAVVVGPGLGRDGATASQVRRLVAESPVPVVVDADGLVALAPLPTEALTSARSPVVLTPHDGEYARLLGTEPGPDRIEAARALAGSAGVVALLKGPTTAVAEPGGRTLLAVHGTAALATAGTGDVLSGIIGAMIARGTGVQEAAALAAHVHGRAASTGRREGLVAGDLPELVSDALGRYERG